ncbi:hypothetical protein [Streptomyces sp. Act143]|uniref:hypothetical protein n=1 Tax=Streptomyces sp. Act143 TaxID=2200760 RepID=UPI0011B4C2A0|nr:hypothetical protein [Streptomyces sp. Act143]
MQFTERGCFLMMSKHGELNKEIIKARQERQCRDYLYLNDAEVKNVIASSVGAVHGDISIENSEKYAGALGVNLSLLFSSISGGFHGGSSYVKRYTLQQTAYGYVNQLFKSVRGLIKIQNPSVDITALKGGDLVLFPAYIDADTSNIVPPCKIDSSEIESGISGRLRWFNIIERLKEKRELVRRQEKYRDQVLLAHVTSPAGGLGHFDDGEPIIAALHLHGQSVVAKEEEDLVGEAVILGWVECVNSSNPAVRLTIGQSGGGKRKVRVERGYSIPRSSPTALDASRSLESASHGRALFEARQEVGSLASGSEASELFPTLVSAESQGCDASANSVDDSVLALSVYVRPICIYR